MGFIHEGLPLLYNGKCISCCIFVLQRCRGRTSQALSVHVSKTTSKGFKDNLNNFDNLSVHVSKTTSKRKRGTKIE